MELVKIIKALGDENRIRIVNILKDQELCVGEIEHILGMSQSNVSKQLNKLSNTDIIVYEKKSQWVIYKINNDIIKKYSFINELINIEIGKLEKCISDKEKLLSYKKSGLTCEQLKECKKF